MAIAMATLEPRCVLSWVQLASYRGGGSRVSFVLSKTVSAMEPRPQLCADLSGPLEVLPDVDKCGEVMIHPG
eukprot:s165_g6.t1